MEQSVAVGHVAAALANGDECLLVADRRQAVAATVVEESLCVLRRNGRIAHRGEVFVETSLLYAVGETVDEHVYVLAAEGLLYALGACHSVQLNDSGLEVVVHAYDALSAYKVDI